MHARTSQLVGCRTARDRNGIGKPHAPALTAVGGSGCVMLQPSLCGSLVRPNDTQHVVGIFFCMLFRVRCVRCCDVLSSPVGGRNGKLHTPFTWRASLIVFDNCTQIYRSSKCQHLYAGRRALPGQTCWATLKRVRSRAIMIDVHARTCNRRSAPSIKWVAASAQPPIM